MDTANQQILNQLANLQHDLQQTRREISMRFSTLEAALRINGYFNGEDIPHTRRESPLLKMIWLIACTGLSVVVFYFMMHSF